jgi:hypothetical protein
VLAGAEGEGKDAGIMRGVGALSTNCGATRVRSKAEIRAECIGSLRVRSCHGWD